MKEENKSSILQAIFKIVCNHFARQNCRARVNVNATHDSPCKKKKAVFENPNTACGRHVPMHVAARVRFVILCFDFTRKVDITCIPRFPRLGLYCTENIVWNASMACSCTTLSFTNHQNTRLVEALFATSEFSKYLDINSVLISNEQYCLSYKFSPRVPRSRERSRSLRVLRVWNC